MKLSTKSRYSARLMLNLALHYNREPEKPVLLRDIAEAEDISEKYLSLIVSPLKAQGLINSVRGAHGGYRLAKRPEDVTLLEIMETVEGSLCPVDCIDDSSLCDRISICVTREIWQKMRNKMREVLEAVNLKDMALRYREKEKSSLEFVPRYSI